LEARALLRAAPLAIAFLAGYAVDAFFTIGAI
jgi:hypothetical protein